MKVLEYCYFEESDVARKKTFAESERNYSLLAVNNALFKALGGNVHLEKCIFSFLQGTALKIKN